MESELINHLGQVLDVEVKITSTVSGGDINEAFALISSDQKFFVKWNDSKDAMHMFQCESDALKQLSETEAITIPEIFACGKFESRAYLVLEYIETKSTASALDLRSFGKQLASLHLTESTYFGWESDNYIGSLVQSNEKHEEWAEFYITQRIEPQIELAKSQRHLPSISINIINRFYKELESLLAEVSPSLLHGDLWSGNYIIDQSGQSFLIDPASYYGDNEIDIAMTELFGGFGKSFYEGYQETKQFSDMYQDKKELYQLYYLLVHLNLFGKSYESSCENILKRFI